MSSLLSASFVVSFAASCAAFAISSAPFAKNESAFVSDTRPGLCRVKGWLGRVQCVGLEADKLAHSSAACSHRCCMDGTCEVWQFRTDFGCFRGQPAECSRSSYNGFVGPGLQGARIRDPACAARVQFTPTEEVWEHDHILGANFLCSIDPYLRGPDVMQFNGPDGEVYTTRRSGPGLHEFEIFSSCWSNDQHPQRCCQPDDPVNCWSYPEHREYCCRVDSEWDLATDTFPDRHIVISKRLSQDKLRKWEGVIPKTRIDEHEFEAKRLQWRVGTHPPSELCSATAHRDAQGREEEDHSRLRFFWRELRNAGAELSHTFVNLGSGHCQGRDPLYGLLRSDDGHGFRGLAVDVNEEALAKCTEAMANFSVEVTTVHVALSPIAASSQLEAPLAGLLQVAGSPVDRVEAPRPLGVLVVDIDSYDCLIAEDLLRLVRPTLLLLEVAFHIPPPFRFSKLPDAARLGKWQTEYDVRRLDPTAGCSLSYALHHLGKFGYHLLRLAGTDALLAHVSVAPLLESRLGITLPQDEFLCYRRSILWMNLPSSYTREWFFGSRPALAVGNIWSNLTRLNSLMGHESAPFVLDF